MTSIFTCKIHLEDKFDVEREYTAEVYRYYPGAAGTYYDPPEAEELDFELFDDEGQKVEDDDMLDKAYPRVLTEYLEDYEGKRVDARLPRYEGPDYD
jgi:hypothetical protein